MFNFNFKETICAVSKGVAIGSILGLVLNHYHVPELVQTYVQNMEINSNVEMLDKSLKNTGAIKYKIQADKISYWQEVV